MWINKDSKISTVLQTVFPAERNPPSFTSFPPDPKLQSDWIRTGATCCLWMFFPWKSRPPPFIALPTRRLLSCWGCDHPQATIRTDVRDVNAAAPPADDDGDVLYGRFWWRCADPPDDKKNVDLRSFLSQLITLLSLPLEYSREEEESERKREGRRERGRTFFFSSMWRSEIYGGI